ncbi:9941_t:CDS:2, partial [Scutellospora calospora]
EYQELLINKEIYNTNCDPYGFEEKYKIDVIKQNYIFNYASFFSQIPCKLLANFINDDINDREKIEVFHVFSSKKYLIDNEKGCCRWNFWKLGSIDDDWHHCHDLSYHFTKFILKKLLMFKYLKEKNNKIKEIYEDLFK